MFLAQGLEQTDGASVADIATCQEQLGVNFPVDLVAFLARSNGAEGSVGDGYLAIYSVDEMVEFNELWWEAWPDRRFVAFASDGGGETYALDTSFDPPLIVEVPFASGRGCDFLRRPPPRRPRVPPRRPARDAASWYRRRAGRSRWTPRRGPRRPRAARRCGGRRRSPSPLPPGPRPELVAARASALCLRLRRAAGSRARPGRGRRRGTRRAQPAPAAREDPPGRLPRSARALPRADLDRLRPRPEPV